MRPLMVVIMLFIQISSILSVDAGSEEFDFWVSESPYYPGRGSYLRINQDGEIIDQFLLDDLNISGTAWNRGGFSMSGRYFATMFDQYNLPDHLVIYDTLQDNLILNIEIETTRDATLAWVDDNHIVHGYVLPDETWIIKIINVLDGEVTNTLTSVMVQEAGLDTSRYRPLYNHLRITAILADSLHFDLLSSGSDYTVNWFWETNNIRIDESFISSKAHYNPT